MTKGEIGAEGGGVAVCESACFSSFRSEKVEFGVCYALNDEEHGCDVSEYGEYCSGEETGIIWIEEIVRVEPER